MSKQNKLIIKKARAKNFFSIGNSFMEFDYQSHATTLIVGKNGSGKSSCGPDLITYALYGKPYRDIKVDQLINTVNNKDMLVEIEFSVLGSDYMVRRGQKPAVFEIIKNGEIITREAANRDYQKILESQILKMNIKAFKQLIVVGAASYVPFMELKPSVRRQVIEDILDISIFTKMGDLSRSTERSLKSDVSTFDNELRIRRESVSTQTKNLEILLADKKRLDDTRDDMISKLESDLGVQQDELKKLVSLLPDLKIKAEEHTKITQGISKIDSVISNQKFKIESLKAQCSNINNNTHCNSCGHELGNADTRAEAVERTQLDINEVQTKVSSAEDMRLKLVEKRDSLIQFVDDLNETTAKSREIASNIKSLNSQLSGVLNQDQSFDSIDASRTAIAESNVRITELETEIARLGEDLMYYSLVSSMLKDSGIKSTIVANYLPIINQLINKYLEDFGLFVGFELSPTFEETIKARHRDTFSYNSFSEGERDAIDLAVLFTWRHISELKSTMSCNLLFFDEVGGSSLDTDAMEVMVTMLSKIASNTFLITHREADDELFSRVWRFSKPKNFTEMIEEEN